MTSAKQKLDDLLLQLMQYTLLIAREATWVDDSRWCEQEIELIHNLPKAIRDDGFKEHIHFWNVQRVRFLEWMEESRHETAHHKYRTYQSHLIDQIEKVIQEEGLL